VHDYTVGLKRMIAELKASTRRRKRTKSRPY
jgi:hypothetical protein